MAVEWQSAQIRRQFTTRATLESEYAAALTTPVGDVGTEPGLVLFVVGKLSSALEGAVVAAVVVFVGKNVDDESGNDWLWPAAAAASCAA